MVTTKSKRGRKSISGVPKTATERSRDIRERDDSAIAAASFPDDYANFSTRLLLKAISVSVKDFDSRRTSYIAAELVKRSESAV